MGKILMLLFLIPTLYGGVYDYNNYNNKKYIKYEIHCDDDAMGECSINISTVDRKYIHRIAKLKSYKSWIYVLYIGDSNIYLSNIKLDKYKIEYLLCNSYKNEHVKNDFGMTALVKKDGK